MKDKVLHDYMKIRIVIVYMLLVITSLIFFDNRWNMVIGLTCGALVGILKYIALSKYISNILFKEQGKQYLRIFVNFLSLQAITILLMVFSIKISLWSFFGIVAGLLLIPAIITINSFTEALGMSHNNFQ